LDGAWVEAQGNAIDSAGIIAALGYTPANAGITMTGTAPISVDGGVSNTLASNKTISIRIATSNASGAVPGIGGTSAGNAVVASTLTEAFAATAGNIANSPLLMGAALATGYYSTRGMVWTTAATGSGSFAGSIVQSDYNQHRTGSTANSTCRTYINTDFTDIGGVNSSLSFGYIPWTRQFLMCGFIEAAASADSQYVARVTLGNLVATSGTLTKRGIGLEIQNTAVWFIRHDGTTLTSTNLVYALNATGSRLLRYVLHVNNGTTAIYLQSAGSVWTLAATLGGGPTAYDNGCINMWSTNGTTAADRFTNFRPPCFYHF
jgi:hypothetical protein